MPLNLLLKLDSKREEVVRFRTALADSATHLERAESALRSFDRVRDAIRQEAPKFHEEKGILAGIRAGGPMIYQHQELTKRAIRDEVLDAEVGKEMVLVLARAAQSILDAVEKQQDGVAKTAGRLEGLHWAAQDALAQIADVLRHYATAQNVGDDDDWSGRGAEKDAVTGGSGGGNGKSDPTSGKKKARAKKKRVTKRSPRTNPED
jgi:hypothetical protein